MCCICTADFCADLCPNDCRSRLPQPIISLRRLPPQVRSLVCVSCYSESQLCTRQPCDNAALHCRAPTNLGSPAEGKRLVGHNVVCPHLFSHAVHIAPLQNVAGSVIERRVPSQARGEWERGSTLFVAGEQPLRIVQALHARCYFGKCVDHFGWHTVVLQFHTNCLSLLRCGRLYVCLQSSSSSKFCAQLT